MVSGGQDDEDAPSDRRLYIDDKDIQSAYAGIVARAQSSYRGTEEQSAMALLATYVEELLMTDPRPEPRVFHIR